MNNLDLDDRIIFPAKNWIKLQLGFDFHAKSSLSHSLDRQLQFYTEEKLIIVEQMTIMAPNQLTFSE